MTRTNNWQDHWLDIDCDGSRLREWCINSTKEPGFAHCRVCNLTLKYINIGVRALKDHGKSKKHLEKCKAAADCAPKKSVYKRPLASRDKKKKVVANKRPVARYCNNRPLPKFVLSPPHPPPTNSKYLKPQAQQVIDTTLDPHPYYQDSNIISRNGLVPVYPCCYCPEEFSSKHLLHDHQLFCIMKPPILQAVLPSDTNTMPSPEDETPPSISPHDMGDSHLRAHNQLSFNSEFPRPSKIDFIAGLNLLPKKKAQQVSQRRRNTECESIDLEEVPVTPTTPSSCRTPKLLISHLSRDSNEAYRRRLSFSVDGKLARERNISGDGDCEKEMDVDTVDEKDKRMTVYRSLYNLDVTSLLGQFVIKHFKGDPSLHILSDIESHCLTSPSKSSSTSRLRIRNSSYPITFRGYSGKIGRRFFHQYKFNKAQIKEFMKTVNTGLNKRSRHLYRQMKQCKVVLKPVTKADLRYWIPSQNHLQVDLRPLSMAEIAFWTMPKPTPTLDTVSVFPNGLKFSSPNVNSVLGLKTRRNQPATGSKSGSLQASSLSVSNFVSEEICAELVQNRKVLYRSLLSDCSNNKTNCIHGNEELPCNRSSSYSILRQMLSQTPKCCVVKHQDNSVISSSQASVTHLKQESKLKVRKSKTTLIKAGCDSPDLSESCRVRLSPLSLSDVEQLKTFCTLPGLSSKKRKPSDSKIDGANKKLLIQQEDKKFLGGFSVQVRPANEGDEIKGFSENSSDISSFTKKSTQSSRSKRNQSNSFCTRDEVAKKGSSPHKKNLRSSMSVPLSNGGERTVHLSEESIMFQRRSWNSDNTLKFNSRRTKGLVPNSLSVKRKSVTKEIASDSGQMKTRYQHSKTHNSLNTHKSLYKFRSKRRQQNGSILSNSKLPKDSSAIFKQRLNAAGLIKRDSVSLLNHSAPVNSGRHTEPNLPSVKRPSRQCSTMSDIDTRVTSNFEVGSDERSGKHSTPNGSFRRSKSYSSASGIGRPNRTRSRLKLEKQKNFKLWLQSLRKGNYV